MNKKKAKRTRVLICRVGQAPVVTYLDDPFAFTKTSLLGGGTVQLLTLDDGVTVYCDDDGMAKRLPLNRMIAAVAPPIPDGYDVVITTANAAAPGTLGVHRIHGNFLLARDGRDLTDADLRTYQTMFQEPS